MNMLKLLQDVCIIVGPNIKNIGFMLGRIKCI